MESRLIDLVKEGATESVLIDIHGQVDDELVGLIEQHDGAVVDARPAYRSLRARVPLGALESIAKLDAVQTIHDGAFAVAATQAQTVSRSRVVSEGDGAHRSDEARETYAVDGTGISIAVVFDSVSHLEALQELGELPPRVTILPGHRGESGVAGTLALEVLHDVAPGADLYFASADARTARYAAAVRSLHEMGVDIIVDGVNVFEEPAFQHGTAALAYREVAKKGTLLFISSGNEGNVDSGTAGTWEGDYRVGESVTVDDVPDRAVHYFDADTYANQLTAKSAHGAWLKWSDPDHASSNDYDLFVVASNGVVVARSTTLQSGVQRPFERVWNPVLSGYSLVVVKYSGDARYLHLMAYRGRLTHSTSGAVWGPNALPEAFSIGAVGITDSNGASTTHFSSENKIYGSNSDGPRRIFYDDEGDAITPGSFLAAGGRVIDKPDFVGAHNVSTAMPGRSRYPGTSAAAAHVAGIAALMLEAAGGPDNITRDEVEQALKDSAIDISSPGHDRNSGYGIVQALDAVGAVYSATRNRAPEILNQPDDVIGGIGLDLTVDLAGYVSDPDEDELTIGVSLEQLTGTTTSSLTGTEVTFSSAEQSSARVRASYEDPGGFTRHLYFHVTFRPRIDLAIDPAQVSEDTASATVRLTASLVDGARTEDTEVSVTVGSPGDTAVEGTDYQTVGDLTVTIDAGETEAETTFTLQPVNDGTAEGAEQITVDGSASGLAVNSATLTLNDDDVESTEVTLTLDPDEVDEAGGSRAVRVTGTLNGGARTANTLVTVTVGSASDTADEGTDYADVGELELSIPADRTEGSVTFTLRPTNDATAEGDETISVSGDVAGLTVTGTELVLTDDDAVSTRLLLSVRPDRVSEGALPTDVTVTGTLDAGARETETLVTLTVGALADSAVSDTDYAAVSEVMLTIPANETRAETRFTLSPDDDMIAEGAESITVSGSVSDLTVESALLTLSDNDTASRVIMLSADPASVREDSPEEVTVTAGLDAAARVEDTTVQLSVGAAGDTAVAGTDYRPMDERELTILAGEKAATTAFFLEPLDNEAVDGTRALRVTGTTPAANLRVEPASGARVELKDDDVPAVLVKPAHLTVIEDGSSEYRVTLQAAPTSDVTVSISGVSGDLSLSRTSLVFTTGNYDNPQSVSVTAADDDDSIRDADVTLTHRASGAAEYQGLRAQLVVSIRENDPALVFSTTSVTVPEGEAADYTVALAIEPSENVTVSISGASGDLSLDRTQLVFTRSRWDVAQPVAVTAAEDDDTSTDPAVTLTHRASGGGYDGVVGTVRVTIAEQDTPPTGGGGGGGGGAANIPPVVEREIEDQTLTVGEVLELDIRLNFYDRDQRALDYTVESADPSVATVELSAETTLAIRGIGRGATAITVTAADRRDERASDTFRVVVNGPALVALVPRAADVMREGFVRLINHDDASGEVSITAIDDTGARYGPIALALEAGETVHFNSSDMEDGNAAKGLSGGVGSGEGDWRLVLDSELAFEVLAYIRTEDGFLTAMHDTVPMRDGTYRVAIFNPGSNPNQVSRLRLINPGDAAVEVTVAGVDDAGASPGTPVQFEIPAGESLTLTASDLEAGAGVQGALGDGMGKWRLQVTSEDPIVVMSLLSSPTGHLTNLSTVPDRGPY